MKKFVSILLALVLAASLVVSASAYSVWPCDDPSVTVIAKTSEEAIAEYESVNGETVPTRTYYFQMPNGSVGPKATADVVYTETDDETGTSREILVCKAGEQAPSWYNDYTSGAGVYWWSGPAVPEWAGYQATVVDADQSIFSATVPAKAVMFVWNNGVDGGTDRSKPIYYLAAQTSDIASEYPDPGEYASIPEGADSFDGMIFIVDPDKVEVNALSKKMTCPGTWYFYYGDGCYGSYAEDSAKYAGCVNPDHFDADGNHVGFHKDDEPDPTPSDYLRGDYDQDGKITIMDATRVQNIIAELYTETDSAMITGVDADGDGKLTIMDATRIQNVLAELINMDGTPFSK